MSIERVRAYFETLGIADQIREFTVSSATVELAAAAVGVEGARIAKSLSFKVEERPIIIVVAGDAKVDVSLRRFETVFPAAGSDNSAIELRCEDLERYASNFEAWVDVCKGWREEP